MHLPPQDRRRSNFRTMRTKDKLSHLSNAYWHLALISTAKNPEVEVIKNLVQTLINKERDNAVNY